MQVTKPNQKDNSNQSNTNYIGLFVVQQTKLRENLEAVASANPENINSPIFLDVSHNAKVRLSQAIKYMDIR